MTAVGRPKASRLVVPVAERADPIDRRLALVVPTIDLSHCYRTQVDCFANRVHPMVLRPAVVPRDPLATGQHPRVVVRPWHLDCPMLPVVEGQNLDCPMLLVVAERVLVHPRRQAAAERDSAYPRRRAVEERNPGRPMPLVVAERVLVHPRRQAAAEQDSEHPTVVLPSLRAAVERPRH